MTRRAPIPAWPGITLAIVGTALLGLGWVLQHWARAGDDGLVVL